MSNRKDAEVVLGGPQLAQFLPPFVVGVHPVLLLDRLVPLTPIQGVQVEDVGLAVAGDQIQATGNANALLVEIDGEDLIVDVILAPLRLLIHSKEVGRRDALVLQDLPPDMKDGVHGESGGAAGGVDERFIFPGIEHLHAHVDDPAGREVLTFFALR